MTGPVVDRRSALALIGAGAVLPAAAQASKPADFGFVHGVASGDTAPDGAILWTRVTSLYGPMTAATSAIPVYWAVAESENGKPVANGTAEARWARDFTVKVDVKGLQPGRDYWYWFEADGNRSPVGRFRTLPEGATADAVMAVVSCQLYGNGLFNAYDAIAREPRLDAVVHLGDYIYEYDPLDYGGTNARALNRMVKPMHETVTLADYRARHASYKTDPDLQAAHARAAFICVWDDHETANDGWTGGAENHQPASEGDWKARKAAAMQAYFEWMPIRDPIPGKPWESINRSFQFGDLATLLMVETRLLARSQQADEVVKPVDAASIAAVLKERARPERELLGAPQRAWVERELKASVAAKRPWQVLANQVVMARVPGPDLEKMLGPEEAAETLASVPPAAVARFKASQVAFRAGLPYNLDAWDGYPAARERLYRSFRAAGSRPLILSGDSHAFWANDLFDDGGTLVAAEFGTSAITSPSVGDNIPSVPLGRLLEAAGDEVAFCDQRAKGYILLTLTPARAQADYVAVSTIAAKPYEVTRIASFEAGAADTASRLKRL